MFYSRNENRRKRWYRLLTIGQKKLLLLASLAALLVVFFLGTLIFYTVRAMRFNLDEVTATPGCSMLYDFENRPIAPLTGRSSRPLQWQELPQDLINAFVAREDDAFFSHNGVVISGVLRSCLKNLTSMSFEQGASTITMQLARNVYDLRDKSLDRKLLEAVLAQRIEHRFDKQTIFMQYLSRIYFGRNCDGIRAAAAHYFGKEVKDLNLVECATLAGLVRGPSIFNPERSMKRAMGVKAETLSRMEECGFITPEQQAEATAAPIELHQRSGEEEDVNTYATMWAQEELDELSAQVREKAGTGMSVVSNLNLPVQQLLEQSSERALSAIETSSLYPDEWKTLQPDEAAAEEAKKAFMKLKRPKGLKVRGENNDLTGLLQVCALVVDTRAQGMGNVLAVVAGRCAADGRNRWKDLCRPGRAAAPLLFSCACTPGGDFHIVARDTQQTGRGLGYDLVRAFYDSLHLEYARLPEREEADRLYNGDFLMRRIDLARLLFDLQNKGRGYTLSLIRCIWNRENIAVYAVEPSKAPEYIRRESAVAVANQPPFICEEGAPIILSETLLGQTGVWVMITKPKGICVFVWMGMDDPDSAMAAAPELRPLLTKAAGNLAHVVFNETRALLRQQKEERDKSKPGS